MKTLTLLASAASLACLAASTDSGSAPADPVAKSDPAPKPLTADQVAPSSASAEASKTAPIGPDPKANPNPPTSAKASAGSGKKTWCVWAQAGDETLAVGQIFTTGGHEAETLRSAGRARYASDAEVKAAKDKKSVDVFHLDGI